MNIITPKPISGFPELLPEQQIVFNRCIEIIRRNFELFGFAPIETPAVERKEVLTSKGGEEKEIYAVSRLFVNEGETPETEFALHFDLTVPLARYVAQNKDKLVFPFRRYQIQKVWRGERPQKGRYRELYQCDIDVIGRGSLGLMNDAEIPSVIYRVFTEMNVGKFVVRINNRRLLQGFFESLGVPTEKIAETLRAVDKLEKIGREKVVVELVSKIGISDVTANAILEFVTNDSPTDALLGSLENEPAKSNALFVQGVSELRAVVAGVRSLGVPDEAFKIDLRIARGLGYYTGTVYETQLVANPELGSVCSGGRYDDLASYFTNDKLPGVGISIGLSRLVIALLENGTLSTSASTPAQILVTTMDAARIQDYLRIAADLRASNFPTEVYFEKGRVGDQLKYASRKGFKFAIIAGENEFDSDQVKIKNLDSGEEQSIARDRMVGWIDEWMRQMQR
jgi:histidyl-tRNA synthetase